VRDTLTAAGASPHGMFLISGPTGSGKTTTLYALLQTFACSPKKVLSVEDPVEYHFEHVTQTQVAPQIGLTFASALRSFLRQDPDVILVGEIRDPETAAVAVQAAMTGHLVLASVHANDAVSVVARLLDMGVEPFQLSAGFRGAAAQRLVRRLCLSCRRPRQPTDAERRFLEIHMQAPPNMLFDSCGCPACNGQGFKGRIAVAEAFLTDETMARAIAQKASLSDLSDLARQSGLRSMAADAAEKFAQGLTSFESVMAALVG
jgi:type II secretory ATPase GspE/PulE/Tfp pilus assembly ATPase PilB-like protein